MRICSLPDGDYRCHREVRETRGDRQARATNINVTQQAGVSIENPAETKLRQQLATMLAATFPPPGPFIG